MQGLHHLCPGVTPALHSMVYPTDLDLTAPCGDLGMLQVGGGDRGPDTGDRCRVSLPLLQPLGPHTRPTLLFAK